MSSGVPASYYASYGSPPSAVIVDIRDRMLGVSGSGMDRTIPLETLRLSPGSRGPASIRFPDGARLEVADRAAFERLFESTPGAAIPVSQWDASPRPMIAPIFGVLLFFAIIVFLAYRYVIPVAAGGIAERLPAAVGVAMSDQTLAVLDREVLTPTTLPAQRQHEITMAFEQLHTPGARGRYRLLYRQSSVLGPNALALPSGTIVITDALVALARDDREIVGVLAHEAGHVDRKHGLRLMVQSSFLAVVIGWTLGDLNSLVALAPTQLMEAKYSRDFERDADAHAADLLRRRGIRPSFLADILQRMEGSAERGAGPPEAREAPVMYDYTASHPATAERLTYLRTLP